jgi:hypothetical protein
MTAGRQMAKTEIHVSAMIESGTMGHDTNANSLCGLTAVLLVCGLLSAQHAPETRFPEADKALEAVFAEISAEQARFTEPRQPQDKEWVKRRLEHLFNVDQKARGANMRPRPVDWSPEVREYYAKKLGSRIIAIDRANTAELKELLKIYRWFPVSEFGAKTEMHAWLIVQHADRDVAFQQEVLAILTTLYPKGETDPSSYANLFDRVARNTDKLQRYGTQGRCAGPGKWEPYEVEDPAALDQRRVSVGLSTMAEYLQRSKDRNYCP